MTFVKTVARRMSLTVGLLALAGTAAVLTPAQMVLAQSQAIASAPSTVGDLSEKVWSAALQGQGRDSLDALRTIPAETTNAALKQLRDDNASLEANFQKWDKVRAEKLDAAWKDLDTHLAEPDGYPSLSKALKSAVEVQLLSLNHNDILKDPRVVKVIDKAESFARKAEADGEWLVASDLFFRLNALLDEEGRYRPDVTRLSNRLEMLRLYVPHRMWELRADLVKQLGEKDIAPYNGLGENYADKLAGIDETMMMQAVNRSANYQVDHDDKTLSRMLVGGLDAVETMVTTQDLKAVFPGVGDDDARRNLLAFITRQRDAVTAAGRAANATTLVRVVNDLLKNNDQTVKLPREALLHEFGNGAMGKLDEFSAIIWPDEKARFERMTQGEFSGVGVQIQFDPDSQAIKIVTPLDDTPAQRAGVHAGDLIKKINGESALGLTLNQAVELITGPKGTPVTITIERSVDSEPKDIDFTLKRDTIPVTSVRGWKRTGPHENEWDWFIDPQSKIGYVRLLQFTEDTTRNLKAAISQMQKTGLNGLVLDLRFNPGGLLTQAVSVANVFVNDGTIVSTTSGDEQVANPRAQLIKDIPVAVLVNEGSASASEIVSGAIKHYADTGQIRAVVIGTRSYGKGSVQNVWALDPPGATALLKLTTQYYKVPNGTPEGYILHRRPGAKTWGIDAHLRVDMLPDQIADSIKLRQDADVIAIDETGLPVKNAATPPDPSKLLTDGVDLQLQTALVVLKSQAVAQGAPRASLD